MKTYTTGEIVGDSGIVFIRELPSYKRKNGRNRRMGLFMCTCGKEFRSGIIGVKHGHAKSCGCYHKEVLSMLGTHRLSHTPIYWAWRSIKERVFNKNNEFYKNYGERGITMFPAWINDFVLFNEYASALPHYGEKGLTLDRIDNDGNYEPGNLRWTERHIQNTNTRKRNDNTSGYVGVSRFRNKWQAALGGRHLGHFNTKEQAVIARNNYIIANNLIEYKIQEVVQ